jgi:signal transduction histidine kinase
MQDSLIQRLSKFYHKAQISLIVFVLFPTILTSSVGIVALALYDGFKDVIFGILTILFGIAILAGAIISYIYTRKVSILAKRQTAFLANISHELKSPLAVIKLHSQTLIEGKCDDSRDLCLNYILSSTNRLERLIEQILQWKRIYSKQEIIHCQEENGNNPLNLAIENFKSLNNEFPNVFSIELCENAPVFMIDTVPLSRAIFNLMENAYKYSDPKNRKIHLSTRITTNNETQTDFFEYIVKDNGCGIEIVNHELIFEEFFRVEINPRGQAGLGLGLGIAKSISVAHGGDLLIESKIGIGSTFTISIPIKH